MSRMVFAASVAVLIATAVSVDAQQARPDLSGRWTLAPDLSTPANTHAFGQTLVLSQSADTFTLEEHSQHVLFTAGGSDPTPRGESSGTFRATYLTDGADHDVPVPTTATAPANAPRGVSSLQAKSYRAVYSGRQLIIMIRDSSVLSRGTDQPVTIHRMARQALTLNADGSLTAENLIVADPIPGFFFFNAPEVEQPAPVPVRSVYRRAQ